MVAVAVSRAWLFFSATMPKPSLARWHQMLRNPVTMSLQRQAAPAVRRRNASVLYNESPFLSLPASTGRQPHQSGWGEAVSSQSRVESVPRGLPHADFQRKSNASSPMPGLSSAANEVATTPE
jgi:hypothetical protein